MRILFIFVILLVAQLAAILAPIRAVWAILSGNSARAWEIAKGYDLLGNTVMNGEAGEYISTRAYYAMQEGKWWGCILCKYLDDIEQNHCKNSAEKQTVFDNKKAT